MKVYPHPTKHKRYRGKLWWLIDIGSRKDRQRIPYEGSYESAVAIGQGLVQPEEIDQKTSLRTQIKELIVLFLTYYKNEVTPATLGDMNKTINSYIVPYFGLLRPLQVNDTVINEFKNDLLEKGLKPITINKHINYFSSILKWAAANTDACGDMVFNLKRFPKKKTVSPQVVPLTKRQVDAVYNHIQPRFRLLFLLMSDQALRVHEAVKVKVEDVDEANELIHVSGKGNRVRQVPFMSDRFAEELGKVLSVKLDGYLVLNPQTKKPYVTIRKELERAAGKAGLTRHVNHHLLRHSCSTRLAEQNMNPHALQKILGHASIETTNKIYTHVSKDFVGNEARKVRNG